MLLRPEPRHCCSVLSASVSVFIDKWATTESKLQVKPFMYDLQCHNQTTCQRLFRKNHKKETWIHVKVHFSKLLQHDVIFDKTLMRPIYNPFKVNRLWAKHNYSHNLMTHNLTQSHFSDVAESTFPAPPSQNWLQVGCLASRSASALLFLPRKTREIFTITTWCWCLRSAPCYFWHGHSIVWQLTLSHCCRWYV